jgi:hypothetical protein
MHLLIEEKASIKWLVSCRAAVDAQKLCPDTMIVSIADREAAEFFRVSLPEAVVYLDLAMSFPKL